MIPMSPFPFSLSAGVAAFLSPNAQSLLIFSCSQSQCHVFPSIVFNLPIQSKTVNSFIVLFNPGGSDPTFPRKRWDLAAGERPTIKA